MSLVHMEGFEVDRLEALLLDFYDHVNLDGGGFAPGRTPDTFALLASEAGTTEIRTHPFTPGTAWSTQFALRSTSDQDQDVMLQLVGATQVTLRFVSVDADFFTAEIINDLGETLRSLRLFRKDVWHFFEWQAQIGPVSTPPDPADGWCLLRANGFLVIPQSPITTDDAGPAADRIELALGAGVGNTVLLDDWLIYDDHEHHPDMTILASYAFLDDDPLMWTPTPAGSHSDTINNLGDDANPDLDFVDSANDGDEDVLVFGPWGRDPIFYAINPRVENLDLVDDHEFQVNALPPITVLAGTQYTYPSIFAEPGDLDFTITYRAIL